MSVNIFIYLPAVYITAKTYKCITDFMYVLFEHKQKFEN